MRSPANRNGFALIITVLLMALAATIVISYLISTRTERATSSIYANRLRAKMTAESGLAAAVQVLHDNTRYGNYVTAMAAPSPSPAPIYTEVYRPADPNDGTHAAQPNSYLQLSNAAGEILVSRATSVSGPNAPQVDPRPKPDVIPTPLPANSPFALPSPVPALVEENLPAYGSGASGNSYNFNQIVRVAGSNNGRLVTPFPSPSPAAALGQWVNVRNAAGDLIGRYAFFIEDESMKVNLNVAGNGSGGIASRPPDVNLPAPVGTPATQVEELDPSYILPVANRSQADSQLTGIGASGNRLMTRSTAALLGAWATPFPDAAYMSTAVSRHDETTARGWQRLDLNTLVAAAQTNADKIALARRISDWIRDAWTGPAQLTSLQSFQLFNDERLRLQIAANIIDYIDTDGTPTDLGDYPNVGVVPPDPTSTGYPIIGIERIPYIVELDVNYKSTVTSKGVPGVDNSGAASIAVNFRVNFQNLFERDLVLQSSIRKILIRGIPTISKEGSIIFDRSTDWFEIPVGAADTSPNVAASTAPISGTVTVGQDNSSNGVAGVKSFTTNAFLTQNVTYTPSLATSSSATSTFGSGAMEIQVWGKDSSGNDARFDSTKISLSSRFARWDNSTSNSLAHDFLENSQQAVSINAHYHSYTGAAISFGDPRYRPTPETVRWYTVTRTDVPRLATSADAAEMDPRAYAVDWCDYVGNRPLLFHRDGPMASIGELGNIPTCEYPWRTLYLQYAGRTENTTDPNAGPEVRDRRGSSLAAATNSNLLPQDYVLLDLFKTSPGNTRTGAVNVNSQFNTIASDQGPDSALYANLPVGGGVPATVAVVGGTTATNLSSTASTLLSQATANRRIAFAPSATGPANTGSPPVDNNPRRPFFLPSEVASDISRLINQSANVQQKVNNRTHTQVVYSIIRSSAGAYGTVTDYQRNYGTDSQVEEPFRKISNAITTRGNVFRVLYVGQAIKDQKDPSGNLGAVESRQEILAEYLGEAFVERRSSFGKASPNATPAVPSNPDIQTTNDSTYNLLSNRVVTE